MLNFSCIFSCIESKVKVLYKFIFLVATDQSPSIKSMKVNQNNFLQKIYNYMIIIAGFNSKSLKLLPERH